MSGRDAPAEVRVDVSFRAESDECDSHLSWLELSWFAISRACPLSAVLELAASEATTNELKRHAKSALDDVPVRATWSRSPI